jgi:hypothetical protein
MDQSAMAFTSGVDFPIHENYRDEDEGTEDYNQTKYEKFGNAHNIESIQNLGLSALDLTETHAQARESRLTLHEGPPQAYNGGKLHEASQTFMHPNQGSDAFILNSETRGFEKELAGRQSFGFKHSDASMHNTMLITQKHGQIKAGGPGMEDSMYDNRFQYENASPSPTGAKPFKDIMKDVPIKVGKRNLSLAYQTKTTRNTSLKSPLDHVLKTIGTGSHQNHNRSKSEMYNTILGFIDRNGGGETRNDDANY